MMDSKIKQQAEKIRQQGDDNAELRNKVVDLFNDYERQKKELIDDYEKQKKEIKESYERQASRTPDTRRSTTPLQDDGDDGKLTRQESSRRTYGYR